MGRHPTHPGDLQPLPPPSPKAPLFAIRLSNKAYAHLRERAERYGYVKTESERPRGLNNYLAIALAHPNQTWADTRPDYLVRLSERLLDPSQDANRRLGAERTATQLFSPDLPRPTQRLTSIQRAGPRHAIWWDTEIYPGPRFGRMFVADKFPLDYFARLALEWGIGDPTLKQFQLAPVARAANALEAIGLGSLTPLMEVQNPFPPRSSKVRRSTFKEMVW